MSFTDFFLNAGLLLLVKWQDKESIAEVITWMPPLLHQVGARGTGCKRNRREIWAIVSKPRMPVLCENCVRAARHWIHSLVFALMYGNCIRTVENGRYSSSFACQGPLIYPFYNLCFARG